MLKPAILYKEQLETAYINTWYDDIYKFYHGLYRRCLEIDTNNWTRFQFASVDKDDNLIGYISYNVDRPINGVNDFGIINFSDNMLEFGKDVFRMIEDIFLRYNFDRVEWWVVVGNPIESTYDKLCQKYGGRIIGITRNSVKLIDNSIHNSKLYEILREDFLNSIKGKRINV